MDYQIDGNVVRATVNHCNYCGMLQYIMSDMKRFLSGSTPICDEVIRPLIMTYIRKYAKSSYVGIAICSEKDTFDLEKGKRIARAKALRKYYKDMRKIINLFRTDMCKLLNYADRTLARADERYTYYGIADKLADDPDYLSKNKNMHKLIKEFNPWFM